MKSPTEVQELLEGLAGDNLETREGQGEPHKCRTCGEAELGQKYNNGDGK